MQHKNQLTDMLTTLRAIFEEHPDGLKLDGEMTRALTAGLIDMERAAAALEQAEVERRELLLIEQDGVKYRRALVDLGADLRGLGEALRSCIRSARPLPVEDCLTHLGSLKRWSMRIEKLSVLDVAPSQESSNVIVFPVVPRLRQAGDLGGAA